MQEFVLRQNIAHYRALMGAATDQRQKDALIALLRQAEAELRDLVFIGPKQGSGAGVTA